MVKHDNYTSESNTFLGAAYVEVELLKDLKFKTNYSLKNIIVETGRLAIHTRREVLQTMAPQQILSIKIEEPTGRIH